MSKRARYDPSLIRTARSWLPGATSEFYETALLECTLINVHSKIDATKPCLDEPEHRLEWARLRARGEGKVKLADFM